MRQRLLLVLTSSLVLLAAALTGVQYSGASWTAGSTTATDVAAAFDWTPPVVEVQSPGAAVLGLVTVTATVSDRSALTDVSIEMAPAGSPTWTELGDCTAPPFGSSLTYSCTWDTTLVTDGDFQLRGSATDTALVGPYSATSAVVTTQVVNATSVVLTPVAATVNGVVSLTGTFHQAVNPVAKMYLEHSADGTTWTEVCAAQSGVSSITCAWDTGPVAEGSHRVRTRAEAGNKVYLDSQEVVVDRRPPTVDLVVPPGPLFGTVVVAATADGTGSSVESVTFEHQPRGSAGGWLLCGTDRTAPYSCQLDTTTLGNGAHDLRATAVDGAGNPASATVGRDVDNSAAVVVLTSPTAGSTVGGDVPVAVDASSVRGVAQVQVEARPVGGTFAEVCTDTSSSYGCTWSTGLLPAGGYELRANLTEADGVVTRSAVVEVTVSNTVASVSILSPLPDSTVTGSPTVTASAVSPAGVASVAVQARPTSTSGWTTLCTDTTPLPYSCPWDTSATVHGSYDLRAVMTQVGGAQVTASVVTVTVNNVTGSVSITAPVAGGLVSGRAAVSADATSNAGVTSVRLQSRRRTALGTEPFTDICASPTVSGTSHTCPSWDVSSFPYGEHELRAVMVRGGDGVTTTSAVVTVTVDNRVFGGLDVQGTTGTRNDTPSPGDVLLLTYTGTVRFTSLKADWDGSPTSVGVSAVAGATGSTPDQLQLAGANLGVVQVDSGFVTSGTIAFAGSTVSASHELRDGAPVTVVRVTLGTPAAALRSVRGSTVLGWVPVPVVDVHGRTSATTAVTESGPADGDF